MDDDESNLPWRKMRHKWCVRSAWKAVRPPPSALLCIIFSSKQPNATYILHCCIQLFKASPFALPCIIFSSKQCDAVYFFTQMQCICSSLATFTFFRHALAEVEERGQQRVKVNIHACLVGDQILERVSRREKVKVKMAGGGCFRCLRFLVLR